MSGAASSPACAAPSSGTPRTGVLIISPIAVARGDGGWHTLDLWARDINAQATLVPVTLVCPIQSTIEGNIGTLAPSITVLSSDAQTLAAAVARARCIQLPGNAGWRGARLARQVLALARRHGTPVFLGISSNRARTALLNSRHQGLARRARALVHYVDIRFTQRWLARRCTGVFIVGEGLRSLVHGVNTNLHVGIASWISEKDIRTDRPAPGSAALRVCMAGRLESMKGFHIGLDALALLRPQLTPQITLIGAGPEKAALKAQVERLALEHFTLLEPVAYPGPFFTLLDTQDLVLLTNLNDEQPRLVFDALCRGALPVCPDAAAYVALGLDQRLLYRQGDPQALAQCVRGLEDPEVRDELRALSAPLLQRHTLDAMHADRLAWMQASATPSPS